MYFYRTYSIKTKILSMMETGYFLKITKIYSQQEKPIWPNRRNKFPQNTKNRQCAKILCHTVLKVLEKLLGPVVKPFCLYSDRHLSSPTNINVQSAREVMRVKVMIGQDKFLWTWQLLVTSFRNVGGQERRICMLLVGVKLTGTPLFQCQWNFPRGKGFRV